MFIIAMSVAVSKKTHPRLSNFLPHWRLPRGQQVQDVPPQEEGPEEEREREEKKQVSVSRERDRHFCW